MNKSLKMAAAVALVAALGIVGIGPLPFPDDNAGDSFKVAIGPLPFPDDNAGDSFIGPLP